MLKNVQRRALQLMIFLGVTRCLALSVIIHASNPLLVLNAADVRHLFLHDIASFPDGRAAHPYDNVSLREYFYANVANKSALQMRAYWARIVFTSAGSPPPSLADDAAVISQIEHDHNAIGYVRDSSDLPRDIRVVLVIP